jgi:thioredoxin 1
MTLELTNENFSDVLTENGVSVVDFWAEWCGPCRMLGPIVDEVARGYSDSETVKIGKVNVDENTDLAHKYGIRSIPTILFLKNGELVDKFVGVKTKDEIEEKINSILN